MMIISNFNPPKADQISNWGRNQKGFTLVELLTTIIVLVAVGAVIGGIVTSSFRGTNKTNVIENIRQNGNYVLAQVARNIEYAKVFNGLSADGTTYVTTCPFSRAPTPTPVITAYDFIKVTPFNSSPIIYTCTYFAPLTIAANGVSLVDTNTISLTDCTIACVQTKETDVPIIKVGFKLGPKNPSGLVESSSPPILFETSVTIRNYRR